MRRLAELALPHSIVSYTNPENEPPNSLVFIARKAFGHANSVASFRY